VFVCVSASDAEAALKMMMMTGSTAVPLAALQTAAGHRQRVQHAAASYLAASPGLRHAAPLAAISPPAMYGQSHRLANVFICAKP